MTPQLMKKIDSLISQLKQKRFRITKIRKALLEMLITQQTPLSVSDIQQKLGAISQSANKTTIYRELEFLQSLGLVNEILLGEDKKRYEFTEDSQHHHHLICIECGSIQDIHLPKELNHIEQTIEHIHQFSISRHALEFFGTCKKCTPK